MKEHPQFDEDFDLHVLGTLDLEDRDAIELHLTHCADCVHRLEEARGRVAVLALAAPLEAPPPGARERLLQRVRTESRAARRGSPVSPFLRWANAVLAVATAALIIAAGVLAVQNHRLSLRLSELEKAEQQLEAARNTQASEAARARNVLDVLTAPDTLKVTLVAGPARPVPQGKAFYNPAKGLLFYAANLAALPANKAYELWLVPLTGNPIGAGVFNTDRRGNGELVLPALPAGVTAKAFAVTIEPAGGSAAPTGSKVLVGVVS